MLNPLTLPASLLDDLREIAEAVKCLPRIEAMLRDRLDGLQASMDTLDERVEGRLSPHLDPMLPELVANRESAEQLPGEIAGLRSDLRDVRAHIGEVREVVEPLQGASERIGRINAKLPGGD
jgi:hypothetical protein